MRLARPGSRHRIPWLEEPNEPVLAAILHDLGLGPEPHDHDAAAAKPVVLSRSGRLAPKRSATRTFGLLGPGRRVRATLEVAGALRPASARASSSTATAGGSRRARSPKG